nr:MAG TPA: hypothetical protein [Caudoviricetes sp.]
MVAARTWGLISKQLALERRTTLICQSATLTMQR